MIFNPTVDNNWACHLYLLKVAITAPRDEALSRDYDHFEHVSNIFGSSFLCEFGQKINRKNMAL